MFTYVLDMSSDESCSDNYFGLIEGPLRKRLKLSGLRYVRETLSKNPLAAIEVMHSLAITLIGNYGK